MIIKNNSIKTYIDKITFILYETDDEDDVDGGVRDDGNNDDKLGNMS